MCVPAKGAFPLSIRQAVAIHLPENRATAEYAPVFSPSTTDEQNANAIDLGPGAEIGGVALAHRDLAAVHFTGSTATFRQLFRAVGANVDRYCSYPRVVGETGRDVRVFTAARGHRVRDTQVGENRIRRSLAVALALQRDDRAASGRWRSEPESPGHRAAR